MHTCIIKIRLQTYSKLKVESDSRPNWNDIAIIECKSGCYAAVSNTSHSHWVSCGLYETIRYKKPPIFSLLSLFLNSEKNTEIQKWKSEKFKCGSQDPVVSEAHGAPNQDGFPDWRPGCEHFRSKADKVFVNKMVWMLVHLRRSWWELMWLLPHTSPTSLNPSPSQLFEWDT
jgi:hypothetical protein